MARFTVVPAFQVSDAGAGEVTAYYPLQHGQTYYVTVRAYDGAGNMASKSSNGVKVDSTPPSAAGAIVTDTGTQAQYPLGKRRLLRPHARSVCTSTSRACVLTGVRSAADGSDVDFTSDSTKLSASWTGFSDAESGVRTRRVPYHACPCRTTAWAPQLTAHASAHATRPQIHHYEYAVGSSTRSTVQNPDAPASASGGWVPVGTATSATFTPDADLADGKYYFSVRAFNQYDAS